MFLHELDLRSASALGMKQSNHLDVDMRYSAASVRNHPANKMVVKLIVLLLLVSILKNMRKLY